ncbi:MAG: arginyl-tRNA synthetase [Candidatus Bathyarchaeota archaeon B26-1]|nr:MAG: arginyl-tRNA synthetase [Candidatus Bathyarchaeota archaeon B26-1]
MLSISINPFADFREECKSLLREAVSNHEGVRSLGSSWIKSSLKRLEPPPNPQFGELTSSFCFEASRRLGIKPIELAAEIVERINLSSSKLVDEVKAEGGGYINFYVNLPNLASLTINSARHLDLEFGRVKAEKTERIIVEHTSVNPIHPLHIGHARNSVLGDTIARILEARGHKVSRHYYIDDVGRQSAIVAYGYKLLRRPKPEGKPDHFIGAIYSLTSCLLEIKRLKGEIETIKWTCEREKLAQLQRSLDEWVSVAAELKERYPELFGKLLDAIEKVEDPEEEVNRLIRSYEAGDEEAKLLIREVCQICLEGFRQTLKRAGITFDSWDWESSLLWSGEVSGCVRKLEETPYVSREGEVLEFNAEKVARDLNLKRSLGLREEYEVPSLTLTRADGTTLYTTRDIAYSIWKFRSADRVINVVGMEQRLAQLQLKLALYALGYMEEAENLVHFAYNMVRLPGYRMSGRRGRYITFDGVMDEAVRRAYDEVSKRSPQLDEDFKRRISEFVGIGAVKYALLSTDPVKPVTFTWDRILDFERNTAPYLQYSHARACSILRKVSWEVDDVEADYSLLRKPAEKSLILLLAKFPDVLIEAAESLKPNVVAEFAYSLADRFNAFYAALPVLKAEPPELRSGRIALVDAVRIVLRNSLRIMGIEAPERM